MSHGIPLRSPDRRRLGTRRTVIQLSKNVELNCPQLIQFRSSMVNCVCGMTTVIVDSLILSKTDLIDSLECGSSGGQSRPSVCCTVFAIIVFLDDPSLYQPFKFQIFMANTFYGRTTLCVDSLMSGAKRSSINRGGTFCERR